MPIPWPMTFHCLLTYYTSTRRYLFQFLLFHPFLSPSLYLALPLADCNRVSLARISILLRLACVYVIGQIIHQSRCTHIHDSFYIHCARDVSSKTIAILPYPITRKYKQQQCPSCDRWIPTITFIILRHGYRFLCYSDCAFLFSLDSKETDFV